MSCLSLSPTQPSSFEDVYQRIQTVTQTRTQQELAALLGICQSGIADAKRRDSIPSDWVLTLFSKLGVNPDWLMQGIGPYICVQIKAISPAITPQPPQSIY